MSSNSSFRTRSSRPREGCRTAGYGHKIEFFPHTYVRVSIFIDVNETKTGFSPRVIRNRCSNSIGGQFQAMPRFDSLYHRFLRRRDPSPFPLARRNPENNINNRTAFGEQQLRVSITARTFLSQDLPVPLRKVESISQH